MKPLKVLYAVKPLKVLYAMTSPDQLVTKILLVNSSHQVVKEVFTAELAVAE